MINIGYITEYECITCNDDTTMNIKELKEHLIKVHGFKKKLVGNKEILMHIKREPRSIFAYKIDFNGVMVYERKY